MFLSPPLSSLDYAASQVLHGPRHNVVEAHSACSHECVESGRDVASPVLLCLSANLATYDQFDFVSRCCPTEPSTEGGWRQAVSNLGQGGKRKLPPSFPHLSWED